MKISASLLLCFSIAASAQTGRLPTWPSHIYDELESHMTQYAGYRKTGFIDGVLTTGPAGNSQLSRLAAAQWIRTAYHDMATADVTTGIGGLDASLLYELGRAENPGLIGSFGFFSNFLSSRASMADLIAMGVQAATRICGGPLVLYRAGRIDAKVAGPPGVPEPQESLTNFTEKFARQGFNSEEMIALVACGHTLGGVHREDFPTILPNGSQPVATVNFDKTMAVFNNDVVTEYLNGSTLNPLVVGPAETNSDQRVFASDGNVTMRALANPQVFADRCATLFAKMIDTVPREVQLTQVIIPYEVKPVEVRLTVANSSTLNFAGDIRVRTTVRVKSTISRVEVIYTGLDGSTQVVLAPRAIFKDGVAFSFDDNFAFYTFNTTILSTSAVKNYIVKITLTNGEIEIHDNNSQSFPVPNLIFFQPSASCGGKFIDVNTPINTSLVAAVHKSRLSLPNPVVRISARKISAVPPIPELFQREVTMEPWTGADVPPIPKEYSWFRVEYSLDSVAFGNQDFDIVSGSGEGAVMDGFRRWGFGRNICPDS